MVCLLGIPNSVMLSLNTSPWTVWRNLPPSHPEHGSPLGPTCAHSIYYPFISVLVATSLLGQTVTEYQSVWMNTAGSCPGECKRAWKRSALIKERDWEDLLWDPVPIHIGRCLRVRHFLSMLNLKSYSRSHGLQTWVCNSGWDPGTHTFKGHKVRQKIFLLTFFVVFAEAQMEIWRHLKLPTCLVLLLKSGLLVDSSHCMTNKPKTLFHLNCLRAFCFVGLIDFADGLVGVFT